VGCWYELGQQGLQATGRLVEEPADADGGTVWRFRRPTDAIAAETGTADATRSPESELPPWLARGVAPAGSGGGRQHAIARGNAVHRLMQSLPNIPTDRRAEAARRFLARRPEFSEAERDEIAREVLALLADKRFAPLFAPGSKAEVTIAGRVGDRPVSGQVDRLAVTDEAVLIADYKSNRPPPRSLEQAQSRHGDYVAQLAVYRAVLAQLYPDRPVRAALVWTATPELMELPASRPRDEA
jgi:ATP-dependent helicase/nuclease subunit A